MATKRLLKKISARAGAAHERSQSDALFLSIGDAAVATDDNGKVTRINQTALDILGFEKREILGKWFPNALIAVDEDGRKIDLIDRPVGQALMTGNPVSEKTIYLTKSGDKVPVFVTVAPIIRNGHPVGAVEVFRDITREQEIDNMKSEFISIASHQLRTPLTAIKTYTHLLASGYQGELNFEQQEFMEIILSSADRMNELINTLLDISRIEEGRLEVNTQRTPIDDLIRELVTELGQMAEGKNIKFKLETSGNEFVLETDPLLLKEVFANLLSNAIKYTPDKGKVTVSLTEFKNEIVFSVTDTGYGIPKSQQKRVYSKFFRADNIASRDTTGTGLGLYLARRIADVLGATIWFKSKEGKGSTFTVVLPKYPLNKN